MLISKLACIAETLVTMASSCGSAIRAATLMSA
jgi:hypothetical protein